MFSTLVTVLVFVLIGTGIGILTGLTPGIHVNTLAALLISSLGAFAVLSNGIQTMLGGSGRGYLTTPLLIAVIIVCAALTHTFVDFIPSTFLGAPDEDTALVMLPGHELLMDGRGFHAVYLSAIGSGMALIGAFLLLVPFKLVVMDLGGYVILRSILVPVLVMASVLLILTEGGLPSIGLRRPSRDRTKMLQIDLAQVRSFAASTLSGLQSWAASRYQRWFKAALVFLLSGLFGVLVLDRTVTSPFGLPSSILLPVLSGLFGIPVLLQSIDETPLIPIQFTEDLPEVDRRAVTSVAVGMSAGSVLGFLPGMTSGHATVLSMAARGDSDNEQVIITLSAVNTANTFFSLMALFMILRARSGAAIAVDELIDISAWRGWPPSAMMVLLGSMALSGAMAFVVTIRLGRLFAGAVDRVPYKELVITIIISLMFINACFTGAFGMFILFTAIAIGTFPGKLGVRRSHLMGVLLVPVILYLSNVL